jgi:hypothetical protein
MKIASRKMPEPVIYILLWLMIFVVPFITSNYNREEGLKRILYDWLRVLPFFIVFLLNNFWLMRYFLFRGKTLIYVITLLSVVLVISISFQVLDPYLHKNDPGVIEERLLRDPQFGREEMSPGYSPGGAGNAPGAPELFNPGKTPGVSPDPRNQYPAKPSVFVLFNTLIISLLIAGFNTSIAVTNRWFTEEQARKEIEKKHIESKLEFLQNQVNPHFLMNTLNNIHSLIEIDQPLAQDAVLKLSGMMRYLLYESGKGTTSLLKEIDFLKSYLELMQLRIDKTITVSLDLPAKVNNVTIAPLLFITFIENAFKHGVSYREPSSISFSLKQTNEYIEFTTENSIPAYGNIDSEVQQGGFGLENIRKRLDMIYGDRYKLDLMVSEKKFRAVLLIPAKKLN